MVSDHNDSRPGAVCVLIVSMPEPLTAEAGTSRQKPQALDISLGTGINSTTMPSVLSARSARIAM